MKLRFLMMIFACACSLAAIDLSAVQGKPPVHAAALDALQAYIKRSDPIAVPLRHLNLTRDNRLGVSCYTFTLTSQHWPVPESGEKPQAWEHTLTIYRPDSVDHDTALLFVNGGTRNPQFFPKRNPSSAQIEFAKMAAASQTIVVDLQDVPNQYLIFSDGKPRKEDGIVAYTWRRFMDNPAAGGAWPLHLPMVKAVVRAMDAVQQVSDSQWHQKITHFVVAGASKRGWATWLSALADERVSGIAPVVIDIPDTKAGIERIYRRYGCAWPPAFQDYVREGVTDGIETSAFDALMTVEDPLSYLKGADGAMYRQRLSIPKYIISASGDDFFLPDASGFYLDKLPGETQLRIVPNQAHYIDMKIVGDAVLAWYLQVLAKDEKPVIKWAKMADGGRSAVIVGRKRPEKITMWYAHSDNCDFRKNAGIVWYPAALTSRCGVGECHYAAPPRMPVKGCTADFVEAEFAGRGTPPLVVTTSVQVQGSDPVCIK